MGIGSIVVGIAAFIFMLGGVVFTVVPILGTLMSFGAPVLALAGIVMGGLALSRAKRDGESTGTAMGGLVVNIVAFIPGVVVALTCGLCNAMCTAGMMNPRPQDPWWMLDGGGPRIIHQPGATPNGYLDAGPPGLAPPAEPPGFGPPPAFPPPPIPGAPDPNPPADPAAPDPDPPTKAPKGLGTALPPP